MLGAQVSDVSFWREHHFPISRIKKFEKTVKEELKQNTAKLWNLVPNHVKSDEWVLPTGKVYFQSSHH